MNWCYKIRVFVIFFLLTALPASANFMVYPMSTKLSADNNTVLRAFSKKAETQYLKLSVKKFINPGTAQEHEVLSQSWDRESLIASPTKFILPAGSSKAVRLNQTTPPSEETLYRVYFESVNANESLAAEDKTQQQPNINLSLNISYAALVRVLPENITFGLSALKDNGKIAIKNTGNIRAGITSIAFCKSNEITKECHKVKYRRYIYPQQRSETKFTQPDGFNWLLITLKEEKVRGADKIISLPL